MNKKKKQKKITASAQESRGISPATIRLALLLAGGTLLSALLYFWLVSVSYLCMKITVLSYFCIAGAAIIAYFIYNRGLVDSAEITPAMLPDTMSAEDKSAYIANIRQRKKKSRCLIVLFFIFLVPLTIDLMKLFVIDRLFPGLF